MDQVVNRQYSSMYPELGTEPVPTFMSTSPEWFEKEREAIFKRCWINVGRAEELPQPNDFLVKDLAVWGTSVLLVHGKDGTIRAFHNVCPHRGNMVAWAESGNCHGFFTCKFHGWVYDQRGKLVQITDEENFFGPDKKKLGLREIACDQWLGFIFVNLNPEQSLQEYLGGLSQAKINKYPFHDLPIRFNYRADERVNWKVALDAQQEGYHVPFLHKNSIALSFPKDLVRFRSQHLEFYGPHRVLSTAASDGFEPTRVGGVAGKLGPTSIDAFAGAANGSGGYAEAMEGVFDFHVIFPNFVIALLYGTYFTYNFWPIAADRTIWDVRMFYPKPANAGQAFANEYGRNGLRDGLLEDGSTHERTQFGLQTGAIEHFQFQDEETSCRHGHLVVQKMVNDYYASRS